MVEKRKKKKKNKKGERKRLPIPGHVNAIERKTPRYLGRVKIRDTSNISAFSAIRKRPALHILMRNCTLMLREL